MKRLHLKNLKKLKQLADSLHSGAEAPLSLKELESITSHFQREGIGGEESPYLWAAAEISNHRADLPRIAEEALITHEPNTDDSYLIHALRYLLVSSNKTKREQLIQTYSHGNEYQLTMTVAEYLVQHNEVERGLRLMISIIPLLNTDHTTADSIALWINELGTPKMREKLIMEADQAAALKDHSRADILKWAANLIV